MIHQQFADVVVDVLPSSKLSNQETDVYEEVQVFTRLRKYFHRLKLNLLPKLLLIEVELIGKVGIVSQLLKGS